MPGLRAVEMRDLAETDVFSKGKTGYERIAQRVNEEKWEIRAILDDS